MRGPGPGRGSLDAVGDGCRHAATAMLVAGEHPFVQAFAAVARAVARPFVGPAMKPWTDTVM